MWKNTMRFYELVWGIICHWFWRFDFPPYESKKRFTMCDGCRIDWRGYWHPSKAPEEVKPQTKENNDGN